MSRSISIEYFDQVCLGRDGLVHRVSTDPLTGLVLNACCNATETTRCDCWGYETPLVPPSSAEPMGPTGPTGPEVNCVVCLVRGRGRLP